MRQIIAGLFITLDGVTEEPSDWQEHFDDDMLAELYGHIARTDAIVLGRVTYDYWAPYWPTATHEPFASYINESQKYVASRSLTEVAWGDRANIALLQGDIVEALNRLKQQPGKDISVAGSPTLVRFLLDTAVLDELTLIVHPVVAGKGRRLFEANGPLIRMQLNKTVTTRTGTVITNYARRA